MITQTPYGEIEQAFGRMWVRTDRTVDALATLSDINEFVNFADDVNASVLDAEGHQVCLQANGWAVVPEGRNVAYIAACIDIAVSVILDRGDA